MLSFNQHNYKQHLQESLLSDGLLVKNFRNCPCKVKVDIHSTYVKPILEYAVAVWAPYTRYSISKLESVQRHGAHFVMSD